MGPGGWVGVCERRAKAEPGTLPSVPCLPSFLPRYTIVIEDLHDRPVSFRPILQETPIGSEDTQMPEWDNLANHCQLWLVTLTLTRKVRNAAKTSHHTFFSVLVPMTSRVQARVDSLELFLGDFSVGSQPHEHLCLSGTA